MVAPQQIIKKKFKGQGFTYYITKLSSFTIWLAQSQVWGFVWSCVCKLSVNKLDNYCKKRKTCLD